MPAQPSNRPDTVAIRAARWLLPLTSVFVVSAAIAHATDQALVRELDTHAARSAVEPQPGYRAIKLDAVAKDGSAISIVCDAPANNVSTDVLVVRAEGLRAVADGICGSRS
jgi:hypothetical protein